MRERRETRRRYAANCGFPREVPPGGTPAVAARAGSTPRIRSAATKAISTRTTGSMRRLGASIERRGADTQLRAGALVAKHLMATAFHRLTPGSLSPLLGRRD
jgi:hypothetical protein